MGVILKTLLSVFMGFFRRLFGGFDSKFDFLEQRGVQMILCVVSVTCYELINHVWWEALIIGVLVYIFWCKGHFYYFQCGTESDKYIDEQLAKGRKPAMNWLVKPVNKWLGFKERSKQYCFVGMTIRYVIWGIPIALMTNSSFMACAFAVPFIYNACFWVEFPQTKWCKSPTNWAEWFSGFFIAWGLS